MGPVGQIKDGVYVMLRQYEMTIGGRAEVAGTYREVINPATGTAVGRCPVATISHLDLAIAEAESAFALWRTSSETQRIQACKTIAEIISANAQELSVLLTQEQGKPLKGLGSEFEIGACSAWASYAASISVPTKIIEDSPGKRVELYREPIGVCACITPWNFPLAIAIFQLIPAIRTGNTVVIKPSPYTPLGTLRLIELIASVLPPGVVNVVAGDDELGAVLTAHPSVKKIAFTGSIPTGRKIMALAAGRLKALTLELGGNDAAIVLPDADVSKIVEPLFWGSMINSGQTCAAIKRLYVHDRIHDELCDALVSYAKQIPLGDGMDESSLLGPLQNERQYAKVAELVEDAKRHGGHVLLGGESGNGRGLFYPVTFVSNITDGVRLVDEEQFGPVLPIIRYQSIDDAIQRANGTDYGLDASVWGTDKEKLASVAARLEAGTVFINKHAEISPNVPFGGIKSSGLGVAFGEEGLAAYTRIKVVNAAV